MGGTFLARDLLQKILAREADVFCFYSLKNINSARFLPVIHPSQPAKIISGGFAQYDAAQDAAQDSTKITTRDSAVGLAAFCKKEKIDVLVLALSPFAQNMLQTACRVGEELSLPLFFLRPKPWLFDNKLLNKNIFFADDIEKLVDVFFAGWHAHVAAADNKKATIFLALGAKDGKNFLTALGKKLTTNPVATLPKIIWRAIYPPENMPANNMIKGLETTTIEIILSPPQSLATEKEFLQNNHVHFLIAKNSGGDNTNNKNKIDAAGQAHIPCFLLSPPSLPADAPTKNIFFDADELAQQIIKNFARQ